MGSKNVVADALSRIDINEIREMANKDLQILSVTTRSMTLQAEVNEKKSEETENKQIINKTPMYVPIIEIMNNSLLRKIIEINFKFVERCGELRIIRNHNKILSKINLNEMIANKRLDLDLILLMLEKEAGNLCINKLKWPTNDEFFKHYKRSKRNRYKNTKKITNISIQTTEIRY